MLIFTLVHSPSKTTHTSKNALRSFVFGSVPSHAIADHGRIDELRAGDEERDAGSEGELAEVRHELVTLRAENAELRDRNSQLLADNSQLRAVNPQSASR